MITFGLLSCITIIHAMDEEMPLQLYDDGKPVAMAVLILKLDNKDLRIFWDEGSEFPVIQIPGDEEGSVCAISATDPNNGEEFTLDLQADWCDLYDLQSMYMFTISLIP